MSFELFTGMKGNGPRMTNIASALSLGAKIIRPFGTKITWRPAPTVERNVFRLKADLCLAIRVTPVLPGAFIFDHSRQE